VLRNDVILLAVTLELASFAGRHLNASLDEGEHVIKASLVIANEAVA
jgi:hypothetical protein